MKPIIFAATLFVMTSAAMAADVGVSINIGQPNFYGRINIGDFPQPRVIYTQPVIVQRPVRYVEQQPIYLRVPPGHAKHWSKHCQAYNACGQQVYFVQDDWYQNEYAPRYREQHDNRQEHRGHHDEDRDDRHEDRGDDHGNGHGNGNGNGKGHGHGHD